MCVCAGGYPSTALNGQVHSLQHRWRPDTLGFSVHTLQFYELFLSGCIPKQEICDIKVDWQRKWDRGHKHFCGLLCSVWFKQKWRFRMLSQWEGWWWVSCLAEVSGILKRLGWQYDAMNSQNVLSLCFTVVKKSNETHPLLLHPHVALVMNSRFSLWSLASIWVFYSLKYYNRWTVLGLNWTYNLNVSVLKACSSWWSQLGSANIEKVKLLTSVPSWLSTAQVHV